LVKLNEQGTSMTLETLMVSHPSVTGKPQPERHSSVLSAPV